MYCLPVDDLCHIEKAFTAKVAEAARDQFINTNSFEIGTYNGRVYSYTWVDKQPLILIENVKASPDSNWGSSYLLGE